MSAFQWVEVVVAIACAAALFVIGLMLIVSVIVTVVRATRRAA